MRSSHKFFLKSNVLQNMLTVGGFTFANRLAGLVNDMMMAVLLGRGVLTDAFLAAFKIPSLFRKIFDQGAFNGAFIPRFSQVLLEKGVQEAENTASRVFTVLLVGLSLSLCFLEGFKGELINLLFPGFKKDPALFQLTVKLSSWCFPYIACATLSAFLGSILNTMGRFAAAAATQLFLNFCVIGSMILGTLSYPTFVHTMGRAVVVAGILQVLWLWGFVRYHGFKIRLSFPPLTDEVKDIFKRMLPTMVSSGLWQINLSVNYTLCSFFLLGPVSTLFFADRLNQLPLRIIGSMLGVALLPAMTQLIQNRHHEKTLQQFNESLRFVISVVFPLSGFMVFMAAPLVSLFYEGGVFSSQDVQETARTFGAFALGLPGYLVSKIFITVFYAHGETKTPLKSSLIAILVNILASSLLIDFYGYAGLAVGASFSALLNSAYLFYVLHRDFSMRIYDSTWRYGGVYSFLTILLSPFWAGFYGFLESFGGNHFYSKKGKVIIVIFTFLLGWILLRILLEKPFVQNKLKTNLNNY